jgi:hypothetical protein
VTEAVRPRALRPRLPFRRISPQTLARRIKDGTIRAMTVLVMGEFTAALGAISVALY